VDIKRKSKPSRNLCSVFLLFKPARAFDAETRRKKPDYGQRRHFLCKTADFYTSS